MVAGNALSFTDVITMAVQVVFPTDQKWFVINIGKMVIRHGENACRHSTQRSGDKEFVSL